MRRGLRLTALIGAALLAIGAAPPGGWYRSVAITPEGGYRIGNPSAEVRLVEYVSYTCHDCARYNIQSEGVLGLAYVPSGRVSIEVRLMTETPIDLTAAMLASCGDSARFFLNHNAILRSQSTWLARMDHASAIQRARWNHPDLGTRNRAIAADLKLYDVMLGRGYDRQSLERCLNDTALARRLATTSRLSSEAGISKTPSFSINGKMLGHVHDWADLRAQLDESLKTQ